jgi:hypothetical protein
MCLWVYMLGQLRCLQTVFSSRALRAWAIRSPPVIQESSEVLMVVVIVIVVLRVSQGDEDGDGGDGKRFESQA